MKQCESEEIGCACPCDRTPTCQDKEIRLAEFSSFGQDPNIAMYSPNQNDPNDGGNKPIEVRFEFFNMQDYYPSEDRTTCGDGAVTITGASSNNPSVYQALDGFNYCFVLFGTTLSLDGSDFITLPPPSSQWVIPVTMKETDNRMDSATFTTGEINLSPSEWYADDCEDYEILVWKRYGTGRGACYISSSELDLGIEECSEDSFPNNNYYLFRFEVRSLADPLITIPVSP